jgi:transposase
MDWPGYSPDLNPLENAWFWMEKQLSNTSKATNTEERQREVTELCVHILRMGDGTQKLKK